jgi:hypothetical protein
MGQLRIRTSGTVAVLGLIFACSEACGGPPEGETTANGHTVAANEDRPESCPAQRPAPEPLPNVEPEHRTLAYWLEQSERYGDPEAVLMSPEAVDAHNQALQLGDDPVGPTPLGQPVDAEALRTELDERLAWMREKLEGGEYVDAEGERITDLDVFAAPSTIDPDPELRVALAKIPLRCGPRTEGLYTPALDLAFDRNACSTVRPQEPIEILMDGPNGMRLARSRYTLGWIAADAPLSPPVPTNERAAVLGPRKAQLLGAAELEGQSLPAGTQLPLVEDQVVVATGDGFRHAAKPADAFPTRRDLTRRAVLEAAFALEGEPYGWGGRDGERDCSRFLLDVFATFGIQLPRHSARQAEAGTFSVDVEALSRREKALLLESANHQGVTLLHFPGHIALYLGENDEGEPMAIHAFSEYLEPCEGLTGDEGEPLEIANRVDRITVSDLSLGEGSSRTDFLSRITEVTVLGPSAGPALRGAADMRPAAPIAHPGEGPCEDGLDAGIFRSPWRPNTQQPMKVMVTLTHDPGPVDLVLFGPDGERVEAEVHELGGPPFTYWAQVDLPSRGRWTAVLGDGPRQVACEHFGVARGKPAPEPRQADAPAWDPVWAWERDTENLYSAFVEQLFREPVGEDVTWPNLQVLLNDPQRNLLHGHRSQDEESALDLEPDCADLPYFLRAYFAWKLRLPFAWRQCSRGRGEGRPPECPAAPKSNLDPVTSSTEVGAFETLIRTLRSNVHSSTQRTVPDTDASDVYPVPITRRALRPGTVFADPYGHIMVIAGWQPQGMDSYGVLLAADAQPDGTVGRRRFWRGSFLFTPETESAGPGFKAWRPAVWDRVENRLELVSNADLRDSEKYTPFSMEQYEGSADDFYDSVEALINPRPLEPASVQRSLVDALEESVVRRVVSVDNGEQWIRQHSGRTMEMPEGSAIFQTSGPWEDFATPSRDMRLLISLDAVVGFADAVRRSPGRFGLDEDDVDATVAELEGVLAEELESRTFSYTRSDGSEQELTLKQVVDRMEAFEMAYNPNDCIEIRWGAPESSDEYGTCRRHAPRGQRAKMREYQGWFDTRHRPPR